MHIPQKTLRNGFSMPVYGLGTWQMGGRFERDPLNDDHADIEAIRKAINAGVTHIDTAEKYADGHSEVLVGTALQEVKREDVFLASKVSSEHFKSDDVMTACKNSLKRLGTDYLDLYLLHTYSDVVPLKETISALNRLVSEGYVRNIGVCNFNVEHLKEAQSYAETPIVCNQVHYNIMFREPEHAGLLEYCQKNDVLISAWRPVQKGILTTAAHDDITRLCKKYDATPSQIAIAWLISQQNVITISKTRNYEHLLENIGSLAIHMESDDIELLRTQYPDQHSISDAVPLR